MFFAAVLVFVLVWGMTGGVLAFVSLGTAPLWLLLGGPTLLATVLAVATLLPARPLRPLSVRAEKLRRVSSIVEMALVSVFLPLATTCLLVIEALPLHGTAEGVTAIVVLLAALVSSFLIARAFFSDIDTPRCTTSM